MGKTDLGVGYRIDPTSPNSRGFPGTRGWFLSGKSVKIRLSYGTDQAKKMKNYLSVCWKTGIAPSSFSGFRGIRGYFLR